MLLYDLNRRMRPAVRRWAVSICSYSKCLPLGPFPLKWTKHYHLCPHGLGDRRQRSLIKICISYWFLKNDSNNCELTRSHGSWQDSTAIFSCQQMFLLAKNCIKQNHWIDFKYIQDYYYVVYTLTFKSICIRYYIPSSSTVL